MRKIVTILSVILLAGLLGTSCKSKVSIVKRHYQKGYHIVVNKAHKNPRVTEDKDLAKSYVRSVAPSVKANTESKSTRISEAYPLEASNSKPTQADVTKKRTVASSPLTKSLNFKPLDIKEPVKELKKGLLKHDMFKSKSSNSEGGLSLFGFIILLILILWLLGFLVGDFGGLIHILLVVALILLILWLLHIV